MKICERMYERDNERNTEYCMVGERFCVPFSFNTLTTFEKMNNFLPKFRFSIA